MHRHKIFLVDMDGLLYLATSLLGLPLSRVALPAMSGVIAISFGGAMPTLRT